MGLSSRSFNTIRYIGAILFHERIVMASDFMIGPNWWWLDLFFHWCLLVLSPQGGSRVETGRRSGFATLRDALWGSELEARTLDRSTDSGRAGTSEGSCVTWWEIPWQSLATVARHMHVFCMRIRWDSTSAIPIVYRHSNVSVSIVHPARSVKIHRQ